MHFFLRFSTILDFDYGNRVFPLSDPPRSIGPGNRLRVTIRMFLHVFHDGLKTTKRSSNDLLTVSL